MSEGVSWRHFATDWGGPQTIGARYMKSIPIQLNETLLRPVTFGLQSQQFNGGLYGPGCEACADYSQQRYNEGTSVPKLHTMIVVNRSADISNASD
ncbi:hypothetical protein AVEN_198090-1 [Araneus ventricosus]|uniref:Uncharacterized protein n=1 Tax=Araneus ventricosus TaxID=182803 RepID=A0A4Y2VX88_ARAVE|nr:hypothetical protein AVEN_198090-1 [Araneus ventricosus]